MLSTEPGRHDIPVVFDDVSYDIRSMHLHVNTIK